MKATHSSAPETSSYGQILKSSSIIGGSAAVSVIVGFARAKAGALFLGPSGVGLVALFVNLFALLRTLSSLGINSSGVREVAEAMGNGDQARLGTVVLVLRRVCWITGFLGWLLAVVLAWPLSQLTFDNHEHALTIAILGATLLFAAISGGQTALIQGTRRIGDLAKINMSTAVATTVVSVILYWALGERGIVPALFLTGVVSLGISWRFARRIEVPPTEALAWHQIWNHSKRLLQLGVALMWSGLLSSGAMLLTSALVVRELGLQANGYYSAAWSLSGMFATFILGAMGADYYPRLTAVASDRVKTCTLVNEQTEIGMLLALPGLVATIGFAPFLIKLFYSSEFIVSAGLLPWFVLGMFGRIISWPMGYILLAQGKARLYAGLETAFSLLYVGMAAGLLYTYGLIGLPIAFFALYVVYALIMLSVSRRVCGLRWSKEVCGLITISAGVIFMGLLARWYLPESAALVSGGILIALSAWISLRGLAIRLGPNHPINRLLQRAPFLGKWIVGHKAANNKL